MDFQDEVLQAREWYGDTKNTSGRLNFEHIKETADIILEMCVEADESTLRELYLAGLGHDLFEDTQVDRRIVIENWGAECVRLIDELTNMKGDGDFDDYLNHLSVASIEVVLVKLADILSNLRDSLVRFETLDKQWVNSFWLPLLKRYQNVLLSRDYHQYSSVISRFRDEIAEGIRRLEVKLAES